MKLDDQRNSTTTKPAKGPGYLVIIVLLWMFIILYLFTMIGDGLESKTTTGLENRLDSDQLLPEPENYTNYSARLDEVVLARGPSGHYIHKGQINDEDVIFIIDTGASDISIPGHIAERLQLDEGEKIYFQTANGVATGFRTILDTVSMGDVILEDVRASINPNVNVNYILLGMSFLREVSFSQDGGTLIIRQ